MKLFLIAFSCVLCASLTYGQEVSNKQRLAELPELIEKEAAKENFELAGKLQQELEIRENLEVAIKDKDYKKAAQLREDLNNLEKKPSQAQTTSGSSPRPTQLKNKNSVFYADFTLAGMSLYSYDQHFYGYMYDENGYYVGMNEYAVRQTDMMYSINIKLGSKFYFGPGESKFRVGLDANYLSLNLGLSSNNNISGVIPNLNLSLARPGVVFTILLNDNMGFDFQANGGLMLVLSRYNNSPFPMIGYSVNPQIKYWYKNIGVGVEYNFGGLPDDNVSYQHLGLSFGLRF